MFHTLKIFRSISILLIIISITACDRIPQLEPLSKEAVILSFGDSLTYGTGTEKEQAYPARLQQLLSRTVINAGISGEVSKTGLARLDILLERHHPQLLILCHGGNDILRGYNLKQTKDNIQKMINLAKTNNTQVVLIGVPKFGLFLQSLPLYEELATANQLPLEDSVLSEILNDNRLKSDHIHPNADGYALIANRIHALLQKYGAIPEKS